MGWIGETVDSIRSIQIRQLLNQAISLESRVPWVEKTFSGSDAADPLPGNGVAQRSVVPGQVRNPSSLDAERLVTQSSKSLRTSLHTIDVHMARNISCPVSPIGSPLLSSRSPPHFNGRMSPSPISSPHTASGSCTPLTGGTGAIPFQINRPFVFNDGVGSQFKLSPSLFLGASHLENFRGLHTAYHTLPEVVSSDNNILGKQFERLSPHETCNVPLVMADRVSEQLLHDHQKSYPILDPGPSSTFPRRMNG